MAGKAKVKETIKRNTIKNMQELEVYKPEYDAIIEIYSELCEQYERLTDKYKREGYKFSEKTDGGGTKKAPIVATLECLRKDILSYSDRLCINPKSMSEKRINDKNNKGKGSALAMALMEIEN